MLRNINVLFIKICLEDCVRIIKFLVYIASSVMFTLVDVYNLSRKKIFMNYIFQFVYLKK